MTMDISKLKALAEVAANPAGKTWSERTREHNEYENYAKPRTLLALVARLEAAERVVEAAKCACGLIRNKAFDLPDAIAAYDRDTAEAAKEVGDAER